MCTSDSQLPSHGKDNAKDDTLKIDIDMAAVKAQAEQKDDDNTLNSPVLGLSKKKRPRLEIEWKDVCLEVTVEGEGRKLPCCRKKGEDAVEKKKQILQDVRGKARPGELLALMGPSGAGKTTLLNCLSGRNTKFTGEVMLNGKPWSSSLRRVSAYIQQDDVLPAHLTPLEHLTIMAKLRMDRKVTDEERAAVVQEAIDVMGLRKCADTPIGLPGLERGISGGERKRVSVACEILMDPSIIFCDEPTSGLDSFMAEQVINQLKTLACNPTRPRTIIATIHQPSSQAFALFDRLLLLAGGKMAYLGPNSGAIPYFERFGEHCKCPEYVNPADFFLSLLSPQQNAETVEQICESYVPFDDLPELAAAPGVEVSKTFDHPTSPEVIFADEEVEFKSAYPSAWYTQIAVLCKRSLIIKRRNPQESRAQIMQALFFALIIGCLYFQLDNNQKTVQDVNGLHFIIMMQTLMQQVGPTIQVFAGDMPLYMRENRAGMYSMTALFFSRMLVDAPAQLFLSSIFGTVVYWMANLPNDANTYFGFIAVLVLHSLCGSSFGYLIGCVAPTKEVAQMLMPVVIMPQMLFAGFMVNLETIPEVLRWIKFLSFFRYSYEGLMTNVWSNWGAIGCSQAANCPYSTGDQVLQQLSMPAENYKWCLIALGSMALGVRMLAWFFLVRRAQTYKTADA